jgi:tetratricopeptide (TPR) repeat protein
MLMAGRNAAKLGKYELAAARFRRVLDKAPELTDARVELGWVLLKAGKLEESLREFHRAVKEAPRNETALRGLLEAYREAKNQTGMLETLRALVALRGQDRDLLTQLAFELHNQGQFDEAERYFVTLLGEDKK